MFSSSAFSWFELAYLGGTDVTLHSCFNGQLLVQPIRNFLSVYSQKTREFERANGHWSGSDGINLCLFGRFLICSLSTLTCIVPSIHEKRKLCFSARVNKPAAHCRKLKLGENVRLAVAMEREGLGTRRYPDQKKIEKDKFSL